MKLALCLVLLLALPSPGSSQEISKRAGHLTITVDSSLAFPGGLFVVRYSSRRSLGTVFAILEGRRSLAFSSPAGLRSLVPIPVTTLPGPATLGIEVFGRRGRQRVPMGVEIRSRANAPPALPAATGRDVLTRLPNTMRDGRVLLTALRTVTPAAQWSGPFQPPVAAAPRSTFGAPRTPVGGPQVEGLIDGIYGEYHRGLDYDVPIGTTVQAPAAGTVVLAAHLALSGWTIVLDHGQGIVSVLYHLSRVDVRQEERVMSRAPLGISGETGYVGGPQLHWGVYVMGVAVDPTVMAQAMS